MIGRDVPFDITGGAGSSFRESDFSPLPAYDTFGQSFSPPEVYGLLGLGAPLPVISHGASGFASPIAVAPLVNETVVISGSASPSPIALSVPMNGQADAPPTVTEVAITQAAANGNGNGGPAANGNGNGGPAANGNGNGGPAIKSKQWMWLGALGLGILLLARTGTAQEPAE